MIGHQVLMGRPARLGVALGALALLLVGCGVDRSDSLSAPSTEASTAERNGTVVQLLSIDNNFLPATLTVAAGTEVVFVNNGRNAHDVTPAGTSSQAAPWGVAAAEFEPGDSYSYVFGTPGTYAYYCSIHGTAKAGMIGTIVVTEP